MAESEQRQSLDISLRSFVWIEKETLMLSMFKNLPLGTSDFKALRSRGQIYVDKTSMLLRLAEGRSAKVLFTRPRRFGKTLLLSTFESLFAEGLRHFDGLAIDGRWTDHTYPVVRLDFSQLAFFADAAEFERKFRDFIAFSFSEAGFECEQPDGSLGFRLSRWFNGLPPDSLVVLVDDYDAPLLAAMGSPSTFEAVASLLREFFAVLHCNEDVLRFLFVTGTVKPANARVFDGFGSLTDISLDSAYGTLAGFTIEELERDLTRPLFNAASEQCLGKEALLSQLEEMYGGYRFDALAEQPVLSPWSVLRFLAEPARGFEQYWFSSPGLSAKLLDNLGENPLLVPSAYSTAHEVRLSELQAAPLPNDLGQVALLAQAGYFTVKSVNAAGFASLGYPNREVTVGMAQIYADMLLGRRR